MGFSMLIFLVVVIPASLHNLVGAIDLLYEHEESKRVRHDEVRYTECLVRDICEELEIDSVAPTDDEGDIF
ncbi:MAG: hypothetical protein WAW59_02860 [Patescibacteria group bacterium]